MAARRKPRESLLRLRRQLFADGRSLASLRWDHSESLLVLTLPQSNLPPVWEISLENMALVECGDLSWEIRALDKFYVLDPATAPDAEDLHEAFGSNASHALLAKYGPCTVAAYLATVKGECDGNRYAGYEMGVLFQYADETGAFHRLRVSPPPEGTAAELVCPGRKVRFLLWEEEARTLTVIFPHQHELPPVTPEILYTVEQVAAGGFLWKVKSTLGVRRVSAPSQLPPRADDCVKEYSGCVMVTYAVTPEQRVASFANSWPDKVLIKFKGASVFCEVGGNSER